MSKGPDVELPSTSIPSHPITESGATGDGRADIASRLLAIVRELALELQPRTGAQLDVGLDSDLDRDLGLDSLGRAELLLRLDRAFKVRLPEQLISDAVTSRDLLNGVLVAKPGGFHVAEQPELRPIALPETVEPKHVSTLLEALEAHVRTQSSRPHIRLWVRDQDEQIITYGDLDHGARRAAAGLIDFGLLPGDRIAIMLPTSNDFFYAFFGVLMAGGIPVPIYPPFRRAQIEDHLRRQAGILHNAQARLLITDDEIRPLSVILMGLSEDLLAVTTITELSRNEEIDAPIPASPDTTALIQYTSGSTGDPKGVALSHANLLANIRAMGETIEASSRDVFVSWLPLYHDMGLIGAWLGCLYYGAPTAIMPPLAFLANPGRWLWSIHRHRATLSAAPNFAFELCLKGARDEDLRGLDLSSLRMVVNGAEAVSPKTIERFTGRFRAFGFRPEAMAPVYGLAENSVGLAFPPVGRPPIVDRVQRSALTVDGEAIAVTSNDMTALEFVACGRPLPGHQIRIVDETGREVADRHEGRLQFRGPSATKGYFRNPEKTLSLFDGDWLNSGDLAYVADGDVYLTGRVKDMIIRAGRHIYPHELEEAVGRIEGVRKGCVVAFAGRDERTGTERLILMAETRFTQDLAKAQLRERILCASLELLETPPDEILLVAPHTVPKTSSGKIRRSSARALYESGTITAGSRALWLQLTRLELQSIRHRARRALRRGAELAYAGYWWALVAAFGCFLWPLVVLLPTRALRHALLGFAGRTFFRLTGIPLEVDGRAVIPKGRVMIIANHASYLDGLVLYAAIPGELSFVAKRDLSEQLVTGTFLKRIGTIFVRRVDPKGGVEDTEAVIRAAQAGVRLVLLPEGTFSRMPGLLSFRLGAFFTAAQAGIPVVPVTIRGTRTVLRGNQWFPHRGRISVHVGEPLLPDGNDFSAAVRLRDRCRAIILERLGEPDLRRERLELPPD